MKSVKILLCILSVLLIFAACSKDSDNPNPEKPDFQGSSNGDAVSDEVKIEFNIEQDFTPEYVAVYKVANKDMKSTEISTLLHIFGFSHPHESKEDGVAVYREDNKELRVEHSGRYSYINSSYSGNEQISKSDEDIKKDAEKLLRDHNLIPMGFYCSKDIKTAVSSDGVVYEKTVTFLRSIVGYEVVGKSEISVTYNQAGIARVICSYNTHTYYTSLPCKTTDQLKEQLLSDEAMVSFDKTKLTDTASIKIDKNSVVYYENDEDSLKYIMPCIKFAGTISDSNGASTEFTSIIPLPTEDSYSQE